MPQIAVHVARVFRARQTLLELFAARNYDVSDYSGASVDEVAAMYEHDQLDMALFNPVTVKSVKIVFHVTKMLRPVNVANYIETVFHADQDIGSGGELVIVSKAVANDSIVSMLNRAWTDEGQYVNVRSLEALQSNIMKHTLVPGTRVLSDEEARVVRERYQIMRDSQLPEISRHDAVAVAMGIRPGTMCEITRGSRTAVVGKYYRICV